jgi:hypothetical protein
MLIVNLDIGGDHASAALPQHMAGPQLARLTLCVLLARQDAAAADAANALLTQLFRAHGLCKLGCGFDDDLKGLRRGYPTWTAFQNMNNVHASSLDVLCLPLAVPVLCFSAPRAAHNPSVAVCRVAVRGRLDHLPPRATAGRPPPSSRGGGGR